MIDTSAGTTFQATPQSSRRSIRALAAGTRARQLFGECRPSLDADRVGGERLAKEPDQHGNLLRPQFGLVEIRPVRDPTVLIRRLPERDQIACSSLSSPASITVGRRSEVVMAGGQVSSLGQRSGMSPERD